MYGLNVFTDQHNDIPSVYISRANEGAFSTEHALGRLFYGTLFLATTNLVRKASEAEVGEFGSCAGSSTGSASYAKVKGGLMRCKVGGKLRFCSVEVEVVRLYRSITKVHHATSHLGIHEPEARPSELR